MMRRWLARWLIAPLLLALLLTIAACSETGNNADTKEIKGQVTAVDATARTFTVRGNDGKTYDFKLASDHKIDLPHVKEHQDQKKEIAVRYRGDAPPYEAITAH